ncbi:hypothetical protein E2C01_073599 [Portunus trituberculatus]|uniref:Uncharacterized protein n=1 Tax=Portunus trituberculatus TaxID=210409 RepID=A0A5B7IC41_PORTR|nr:hypothetical protein [Portunus trituberculatus]
MCLWLPCVRGKVTGRLAEEDSELTHLGCLGNISKYVHSYITSYFSPPAAPPPPSCRPLPFPSINKFLPPLLSSPPPHFYDNFREERGESAPSLHPFCPFGACVTSYVFSSLTLPRTLPLGPPPSPLRPLYTPLYTRCA